MKLRRKRHHRLAAWLGLLALAVQVCLPLLIAAEIRAATAAAPSLSLALAAVPICHAADEQTSGPGTGQPPDRHDRAGCPICTALAASLAFTAAVAPALPVPQGCAIALRVAASAPALSPRFAAAYRSRAPPPLG